MDQHVVTGIAAIIGSLLGATASIFTNWLTHRAHAAHTQMEMELRGREALYGEFISEASRLTVEALTHSLEQPENFVKLYSVVGRIRLVAAEPVLKAAETCCRRIAELYARPNMTAEQIRIEFEQADMDPIRDFSAACRAEMLRIGGRTGRHEWTVA